MWKVNTPILFSTNLLCPFTTAHESKGKTQGAERWMTACAVVPSIEHPAPQPQLTPNKAPVSSLKKLTVFLPSHFIREEMLLISSNCEATVGYVIMCVVRRRLSHMCLLHITPSPDRKQQQGSTGERQHLPHNCQCSCLNPSLPVPTSLRQHPVETSPEETCGPAPCCTSCSSWDCSGKDEEVPDPRPSENGSALGR